MESDGGSEDDTDVVEVVGEGSDELGGIDGARVRGDVEFKFVGGGADIGEGDAGGGVEVTGGDSGEDLGGGEGVSADHDPGAARVSFVDSDGVVVVCIVGSGSEERRAFEVSDADGIGEVPDTFNRGVGGVAEVIDGGVCVVEFEDPGIGIGQLFGVDGIAEVGVIEGDEGD